MSIQTELTRQLGIRHPIMLAGMGQTSGAPLAAAVSNAGGLGVIGGVGYTTTQLKEMIAELKANLNDPNLPFGVDLLLPQVGGAARKTNVDYTRGKLDELIDAIIDGGAKVFVSAVGTPPKYVVERLHKAGVLYMNMVGEFSLHTTRSPPPCIFQLNTHPSQATRNTRTKPAPWAPTSSARKAAKPAGTRGTSRPASSRRRARTSARSTARR